MHEESPYAEVLQNLLHVFRVAPIFSVEVFICKMKPVDICDGRTQTQIINLPAMIRYSFLFFAVFVSRNGTAVSGRSETSVELLFTRVFLVAVVQQHRVCFRDSLRQSCELGTLRPEASEHFSNFLAGSTEAHFVFE